MLFGGNNRIGGEIEAFAVKDGKLLNTFPLIGMNGIYVEGAGQLINDAGEFQIEGALDPCSSLGNAANLPQIADTGRL